MTYVSSWRSPSNIALIKYWGKYDLQLPRNPSLSLTLSACHTNMIMQVTPDAMSPDLTVLYKGQQMPSFIPKIKLFFSLVADLFPWLSASSITIDSINTFPYGAGIASSASAMSAMALCLMDINTQIQGLPADFDVSWWRKASEISRLGSGSACRSIYPLAAIWGETPGVTDSSNSFAMPWEDSIAPVFRNLQDTILIVSKAEKAVSSTAGHSLMNHLAYAEKRYAVARNNLLRLIEAMKQEDSMDEFITIVESEALQLHALMMSGEQPFILMEPGTISIIKEVWRFRKETGISICFTLDAGPNVHLLYPVNDREVVLTWIKNTLVTYCDDGRYILDQVGRGPERITP